MAPKIEKGEKWRFIGNNVPQVEITGPYSNQYRVFIQDQDGDLVALLPREAKRLIGRIEKALVAIDTDKAARILNRKGLKVKTAW